jgi:hypothetical protein
METSIIPEAKESPAGPQQRQGYVDLFFDSCGMVHHEYAPQSQTVTKSITRGYFVAFVMLCGANDRTCEQQNLAALSRQCTRSFFASDSRFFDMHMS